MKNRKSFLIYKDSLDVLDKLSDEDTGKLFKMIKNYQNDCEFTCEFPLDLVFLPFQKQFERDAQKYYKLCEKNRQIALNRHSTSGTKRNQPLPKVPSVTKSTDSDSDSDSDSDNKAFDLFWNNYPRKTDKKRARISFNRLGKAKQKLATVDCKTRFADTEAKYIPHATTYLNGERWEDGMNSTPNKKSWSNAI